MRILVFGGDGMVGHALLRAWRDKHSVWSTVHQGPSAYSSQALFDPARTLFGVEVQRTPDVLHALAEARPEAVINAVGIVKQRTTAKEAIPSLEVNSLFPHRLALACRVAGARLIHLSTDCVFSGTKGSYTERDLPDPGDLYGRTKLLGELADPGCLTLRTSIIGLELARKASLIEWYLAQRGLIRGFRKAIYTGLTTAELAKALETFLIEEPALSGVWHLSSSPITKYDLLLRLGRRLGRTDVELQPDDTFVCDRSLDSSALRARSSYRAPSWDTMLEGLAAETLERKSSS